MTEEWWTKKKGQKESKKKTMEGEYGREVGGGAKKRREKKTFGKKGKNIFDVEREILPSSFEQQQVKTVKKEG